MSRAGSVVRTSAFAFAALLAPLAASAQTSSALVITGVVDGPLPGGVPKAIELYVTSDVADLSAYGVGGANNGGGSDGEEFTFPAVSASAGDYIYVASETTGFSDFFGFEPDYTSFAASINGDDAIELFRNGAVVDVFGEINVDGTGQPWEYLDGWAYRADGSRADGSTFALTNWSFSGPNALDGETSNDTASTPFPVGTFNPFAAPPAVVLPPPPPVCGDPMVDLISTVQGPGFSSPLEGSVVEVEAVVVGDLQGSDELSGFFIQEEDADQDGDDLTSEGLFVFSREFPVNVGDVVRVRGTVIEFFGMTEISPATDVVVCSTGATVTPAAPTFPVAATGDLERYEGMSVDFAQPLFVSDNFNLGRFGEVVLSIDGRQFIPTQIADPGAAAAAVADLNQRTRIVLDDGSTRQNPIPVPPYFAADGTLRAGDQVANLTGVLNFSFGAYKVQPTGPTTFTRENTRDAAPPTVGGRLTVAAFNVLNYFLTLDNGVPICGPSGNLDCRGADNAFELGRQRAKIVDALSRMNSDVVGLIELENDQRAAIEDLVNGVNAVLGAGTYDFIDTGFIGTDAIKVGFIYKPATVTPVGNFAILDSSVDPRFIDTKNRPALAQTFEEVVSGEKLTVIVNHFKSKGSPCDDVGDPNANDGQGNCNGTRTLAMEAMLDWLETDPTQSGDPDFMIIGDLNAYGKEDPIQTALRADYVDLVQRFIPVGQTPYSFTFFGEAGALDYALAGGILVEQVTGAVEWHINADEPRALDYNDFNQPSLFNPDPYRSSDHDPVIVGLDLVPQCFDKNATVYVGIDGNVVGGLGAGHKHRGALVGTFGDDVIVGTDARDVIVGLPGNDRVCALGGSDQIVGGLGDDSLFGGPGPDVILGNAGDDKLSGGDGTDLCRGGLGHDTIEECER
jgi:predicted extracellular nuclease